MGEEADLGACCELFERSWPTGFIRSRRDGDDFAYWSWLNRTPAPRLLQSAGTCCGYLCAGPSEGTLWIDEATTVDLPAPALWQTLRALAEEHGADRIGGWLRPEHAGGPFAAPVRNRCVPMVARLGGALPAASALRAHFSSLDHF